MDAAQLKAFLKGAFPSTHPSFCSFFSPPLKSHFQKDVHKSGLLMKNEQGWIGIWVLFFTSSLITGFKWSSAKFHFGSASSTWDVNYIEDQYS